MKESLTNEQRLRRLRARWKRLRADQKLGLHKTLLPTKDNQKCGVSDYKEKLITPSMMRFAERIFWQKRGIELLPATWAGAAK